MRHYLIILLMTWTAILFILLASWAMLLLGLYMGDFTVFVPIMFAISGVAFFSRTEYFNKNVREPLAKTLDFGSFTEVVIHLQLFTIICGVFGLGVGITALSSFYPLGIKMMLKGMAVGDYEWHNFAKYSPMSVLAGLLFGLLLYSYLFADARKKVWLTRAILIGGFLIFFGMGMLFGSDRFYLVIKD